ncbi:luc7-like protein 3 [Pararge aegeria]|uniref:Jg18980 protein n=2 Tax=Pararge aegeria TaxID=116150 RepID=A0A8S4RDS4_9NEOP|nr:luc7-like protein 3 [Pararge aegeria]XP_039754144.1 luc7-like protein 3 [Pararge aegeria]CAH2234981.1 jg18980 [Pararge aegeria aegeria]
MAVLAAAQLLDELMGRHRNTNPNEKIRKPNWEDPEYCKYYMVKFCPHDLFVNTRADLGACPKVHDDEVKDLFERAESSYKKAQYVEEFLRFCRHMINDVERKIQKGKQRLELMNSKPEGPPMTQAQTEKNQEQVQLLSEKITALVQEAEEAGTCGNVEQAQGLMKLCDRLKEEKDQLLKQQENSHWSMTAELAAAQEKQMEVCPVCGAFLIVGDAQQRIDDHLSGKQHVGYFKLRQAYEEMNEAREKEQQEKERKRREEREKERSARGGGLGSDRRDRERMERDRERDRDKDRSDRGDNTDKEKERQRSSREVRGGRNEEREGREKERERSDRDRERDTKERDTKERDIKDRDTKERDPKERDTKERDTKERDRDRDRDTKDRDRDRDRKHRRERRSSHERGSRRRSRERH